MNVSKSDLMKERQQFAAAPTLITTDIRLLSILRLYINVNILTDLIEFCDLRHTFVMSNTDTHTHQSQVLSVEHRAVLPLFTFSHSHLNTSNPSRAPPRLLLDSSWTPPGLLTLTQSV